MLNLDEQKRLIRGERRRYIIDYIKAFQDIEKSQCEKSFATFMKLGWHLVESAELEWSWHIDTLCGYLEAFARNEIEDNRLIVNIPPGMLKSLIFGVFFPAWTWVIKPEERFLCIANEQGLAVRDALKTKKLVTSEWYQSHWPLPMTADQNEKTLYVNTKGGFRQSQGIEAANTGKRGDTLIIDDPHDMKQIMSDVIRKSVLDTWDNSLSTRINDPNKSKIVLIMQRGHESDLAGHLLKKKKYKWTNLKIPMMYKGKPSFNAAVDINKPELNDPRTKEGQLLFPTRFNKKYVESLCEDLGEYGTASQLQQDPQPAGGAIIKSFWWRVWPVDEKLPPLQFTLHSWDTAFSDKNLKGNAYSACTRMGVFYNYARKRYCVMILGRYYAQVGYDELRAKVKAFNDKFKPDVNVIENKSTGISLIQDFKRASSDVPVHSYTPGKGEDKVSRAYSVSPIIESGICYVPYKPWAIDKLADGGNEEGYIHIIAKFPAGDPPCQDLCDTLTAGLIYLRRRHLLGDHEDDTEAPYSNVPQSEEALEDEAQQEPKRRYYS